MLIPSSLNLATNKATVPIQTSLLPLSIFDFESQNQHETHPLVALRSGEIAHLIGASTPTLLNWERVGKLPKPQRTKGGFRVYSWEDFAAILRGAISSGHAATLARLGKHNGRGLHKRKKSTKAT